MSAIKKIIIGLGVILAIALVIGWWVLDKKEKKSLSLFQHVPSTEYVARVNTAQAMKLVMDLDFDSLKSKKKSKWSALFSDSTRTGIDLLVNPWIFGDGFNLNLAFMINAPQDFQNWMLEIEGVFSSLETKNGETISCYEVEGGFTFCHNTNNVALFSKSKNWKELAIQFYGPKENEVSQFALGNELIQIKLNQPFSINKDLLIIKDTLLKVELDKHSFAINRKEVKEMPFDLYACLPIGPSQLKELKQQDGFRNVLNVVGLKTVKLESNAVLAVSINDTLVKRTKSVAYGFDDNFNKVEKVKYTKTVVPNISLQFEFGSQEESQKFYMVNELSQYSNNDFKIKKDGAKILFYSATKPLFMENNMEQMVYVNCSKLTKTIGLSPVLSFLPTGYLEGVDYLYFDQNKEGASLVMESQIHPVQWLFNLYNKAN